jgi:hypothetical protein
MATIKLTLDGTKKRNDQLSQYSKQGHKDVTIDQLII